MQSGFPAWGIPVIIIAVFFLLFLIYILPAIWSMRVAKRNGYPPALGFLLGLLFSLLGVLIAYILPPKFDPYNYGYMNTNPQPVSPKNVRSNNYKTIFLVRNIEFNSYNEARQYCLDQNISLMEIHIINK